MIVGIWQAITLSVNCQVGFVWSDRSVWLCLFVSRFSDLYTLAYVGELHVDTLTHASFTLFQLQRENSVCRVCLCLLLLCVEEKEDWRCSSKISRAAWSTFVLCVYIARRYWSMCLVNSKDYHKHAHVVEGETDILDYDIESNVFTGK